MVANRIIIEKNNFFQDSTEIDNPIDAVVPLNQSLKKGKKKQTRKKRK